MWEWVNTFGSGWVSENGWVYVGVGRYMWKWMSTCGNGRANESRWIYVGVGW